MSLVSLYYIIVICFEHKYCNITNISVLYSLGFDVTYHMLYSIMMVYMTFEDLLYKFTYDL